MRFTFGPDALCLLGKAANLTVMANVKGSDRVRKYDLNDPLKYRCGVKDGDIKAGSTFVSARVSGLDAR